MISPAAGSLGFSLARTRFQLSPPSDTRPLRLSDEYLPFLCAPGTEPADASYTVSPAGPEEMTASGRVFWDNGVWRMRQVSTRRFDVEIQDAQIGAWRKTAEMADDFATGTLFPSPCSLRTGPLRPFHHPQDRAIVVGRFCHLEGVMVHSSCVWVEGKVLLFAGVSGAGKTTIARLWRSHGATVLNDERNLVRMCDGATWAGASPWHGEDNQVSALTGPLAAVFCLKQSTHNDLRPLPVTESVVRLLTATFVPVFVPEGPARVVETWGKVLEQVPAYELSFTPDGRALDLCRSAIGG